MENKSAAHIWIQWLAIPVTSVLLSYFIWIWSDDHRYFGFTAAWKIFFAFPITFFVIYGLSNFLLKRNFRERTVEVLDLGSLILASSGLAYMIYCVVIAQTVIRWHDVQGLDGDYTGYADIHFKPVLGKLGVFSLSFSFIVIILGIRKNNRLQYVMGFIFILLLISLLWYASEFHPKRFVDGSI